MGADYQQIELGGTKRGLKFNIGTIFIARKVSKDVTAYTQRKDTDEELVPIATIVYAGLLSNCNSKKVDPDFSFDDVMDWILELPSMRELNRITEPFYDLMKTDDVPTEVNGSETPFPAAEGIHVG